MSNPHRTTDNARVPGIEYVSFYPLPAIEAARSSASAGGAWRLYVLAKALDKLGRGAVRRDDLKWHLLTLGIGVRQWQRWIAQARSRGLVSDVQRRGGEWNLVLPSAAVAAHGLGCTSVGKAKITLPASALIGAGWKARIWAAFEETGRGRPISREVLRQITNVPLSTQRYRDSQAGVIRTRNYAKLPVKADSLSIMREFSAHKGLYVRKDGSIGARKPDSREWAGASFISKGRTRKANATLKQLQRDRGLSQVRQALSEIVTTELGPTSSVCVRLFHSTLGQTRAASRPDACGNISTTGEVYLYSYTARNGVRIWIPV